MEIKGPGRVSTPGVSRKKDKKSTDRSGFGKALSTEGSASAGAASGTGPLTSVNSLLALQELPTSTEGRSKGLARVENLLEHLEAIRHGLLLGQIPKQRLMDIVKVVSRQRDAGADEKLSGLLDDLELRVKVELAKLEMMG